jgi:major membrane immunogen (membrane-anchored lipoprotein)
MDNQFVMTQGVALSYVEENKPAGGIPNSINIYDGDIRVYTYNFNHKNGNPRSTTHQAYQGANYIGTETAIKKLVGDAKPIKGAMFEVK